MRGSVGRLLIASLLALSAAVYVVELSGRWDQTLRDVNDEAALVGIVLCVGAALLITDTVVRSFQPTPFARRRGFLVALGRELRNASVVLPPGTQPPIIPLRL